MLRILFLLFLVVPIIEIGLFIALGSAIGLLPTLAGIVVTALIGSAILRAQGVSLIAEIQQVTARGQMPARQIADGFMLAISGALLMTPGYFTDAVGFLLLVPAIRLSIFDFLKTRVVTQTNFHSSGFSAGMGSGGFSSSFGSNPQRPRQDDGVVDLDSQDWREDDKER